MKKDSNNRLFLSPTRRIVAFMIVFTVGAILAEIFNQLIWTRPFMPNLFVLAAFMLLGALFINERHILSRLASASILLVLGAIAIRIGHTVIPDAYLLALGLCIAILGAQPLLHRKRNTYKRTALIGALVVCFAIVFFYVFTDIMTLLQHVSIYEASL